MWSRLRGELGGDVSLNGHPTLRLPGNLNICFHGLDATLLVSELRDVALSVGSACTSAKATPSHVLKALGLADDAVGASLRIGLGRDTQTEEIDRAAERILEEATLLRRASSAGTLKGRPRLAPPARPME